MSSTPKLDVRYAPGGKGQSHARTAEESALVVAAQLGSHGAFEELVRWHQQRVFAVAGGILRRREDVEDVAQQVFVKAYLSLRKFDQRAAFSTWLYKITVNECWDFLRKRKVRPLVYESDLSEEQARQVGSAQEAEAQRGPDAAERLEHRERIKRLLESLEERDRLMLILKEVEGFSVEEIGEILELNANTVKVRLFRARRRMTALHRKGAAGKHRAEPMKPAERKGTSNEGKD